MDTPLDETTIAGLTVGMASQGMKPVAEAQFDGFMYPMVDFIICHAARMRYPVSYTHLDVYKRQHRGRRGGSCTG